MKLHAMGLSTCHPGDFFIDRPSGSGDDLLIVFKTPAFAVLGGEEILLEQNSVVIFPQGSPQIYGGRGDSYVNHWVHFECDKTDFFFEKNEVRFNEPYSGIPLFAIENALRLLSLENISPEQRTGECADQLLRFILAKLSFADNRELQGQSRYEEPLLRIRAQIYSEPSQKYSVARLAAEAALSPSYFQSLYKQHFGVSCLEDVILARLTLAKRYLETTSLSVAQIAEICGYDNDVHFMRQFKQRFGCTALGYRRQKNKPCIL